MTSNNGLVKVLEEKDLREKLDMMLHQFFNLPLYLQTQEHELAQEILNYATRYRELTGHPYHRVCREGNDKRKD